MELFLLICFFFLGCILLWHWYYGKGEYQLLSLFFGCLFLMLFSFNVIWDGYFYPCGQTKEETCTSQLITWNETFQEDANCCSCAHWEKTERDLFCGKMPWPVGGAPDFNKQTNQWDKNSTTIYDGAILNYDNDPDLILSLFAYGLLTLSIFGIFNSIAIFMLRSVRGLP